jgi:hypothetical protein
MVSLQLIEPCLLKTAMLLPRWLINQSQLLMWLETTKYLLHETSSNINLSLPPRFAEDVVFTIISRCTAESCYLISLAKEGKTKDYQFPVSRVLCKKNRYLPRLSAHETIAWSRGWRNDSSYKLLLSQCWPRVLALERPRFDLYYWYLSLA